MNLIWMKVLMILLVKKLYLSDQSKNKDNLSQKDSEILSEIISFKKKYESV